MKKIKNPLRKRLLRDLKSDFGKYLVIFLLLAGTIAIVSGFLVCGGSLVKSYNESFSRYHIEDGHFAVQKSLKISQKETIENEDDVTVYDDSYAEFSLESGATLRIYTGRQDVNQIDLMSGSLPEKDDEIALDRAFAVNNEISLGDTLTLTGENKTYTVTALVAFSDYSALFSNNNDMMFDAVKFGVAYVTEEAFASYPKEAMTWNYAWKYKETPADETAEKEMSEDFLKKLNNQVSLEAYIPRYQNQAINFTGEDLGSDTGMMIILLYIIVAIMAFVCAITTSNTIVREANVIGTLRASGYTRGELLRHYMAMPVIVTFVAAIVGNILGYTVLEDFCVDLEYNSYSLTHYESVFSMDALVETTLIPIIVMVVIIFLVIFAKLRLSPLKFLRRDLSRRKNKRALPLSRAIRFMARFRLRVIFQNGANYIILFIGIFFGEVLLLFGLGMPDMLTNYENAVGENLISPYTTILTVPVSAMNEERKLESLLNMMVFEKEVETDNDTAEAFTAYSLQLVAGNAFDDNYKGISGRLAEPDMTEEVTIYGIKEGSRYMDVETEENEAYISSALANKYDLKVGDSLTLSEKYEEDTYTFRVAGVKQYNTGMVLFMSQKALNAMLDYDEDYFCGYFSETPITDIDKEYIGTTIDYDSVTKVSRQLFVSMGGMMGIVDGFAVIMFVVLMYLLTKIIIEKNAQSISMAKILGYRGGEIEGLYIRPTTIVIVLSLLASIPLSVIVIRLVWKVMFVTEMSGWIDCVFANDIYLKMFLLGIASYVLVVLFELFRIRKIPKDQALKNME